MKPLTFLCPLIILVDAARNRPSDLLKDDDNPLLVVYVENWSVWGRGFMASLVDKLLVNRELPYRKLVLNHAFHVQAHDDCSLRTTDEQADTQTPDSGYGYQGWGNPWDAPEVAGMLGGLMTLKKAHPEIILLPSIGGWSRSQEFRHCIQEENRQKFADAIIQHIEFLGFDGVDLDWEYPSCEGGCGCQGENVCSSTPNQAGHGDWEVYKSFLTYLRQRLTSAGDRLDKYLYISMALGMNPDLLMGQGKWDVPTPFDFLCEDDSPVDWMNLMTYDYFGPWAPLTGPLSPLLDTPGIEDDDRMNIKYGLEYIKGQCSNMNKLTMGLATYGKTWAGVPRQGSPPGLWQQATANPSAGDGTYSDGPGTLSIWDIEANYRGFCTEFFDEVSRSASLFCDKSPRGLSNVFITYESGEVWKQKMTMARDYGMSGAMIWAASDFVNGEIDVTPELLGGLFSGWSGVVYVPPPAKAPSSVTRLKQWPGYPCPISSEHSNGCTVAGPPTIQFPSDDSVNLAGSSASLPTVAPLITTTASRLTHATTSAKLQISSASTSAQISSDIIDECENLISSEGSTFETDCKAKCQYYGTDGSSMCGTISSGLDLAQCVQDFHTYCFIAADHPTISPASSTSAVRSTPPTSSIAEATEKSCEDLVAGTAPHWDEFCREKCADYVIGGPRQPWCSGATANAQAACVIKEWQACVIVLV